ncbi:MAG: zf-HC2 domain-containing protein [Phycisphaerales bacterium]|nr:zf-HC2 domain-containing protein [Phycisphaerales bacterium]
MTDKSEQLEELLSRRLDGDLTAEEQARVDRAMAEDPSKKAMADRYDRLNMLLQAYRRLPEDVDWSRFFRRVTRQIDENRTARTPAEVDQALDHSLENWARPMPDVDWDAFKARVSAAVRQEAASTGAASVRWPASVRWFAPLAAAAAIALVVWWNPWSQTNIPNSATTIVVVSLDMPREAGPISISFDESSGLGKVEDPPLGSSAIAIGPRKYETADAFDEAYFY